MANDIEVSVGYQDIQTLRRELVGIAKDAKTSATTFEREFNKVERTLKANAKASQTYYASVLKLDQASKSASASASVFVKALNEEAKAVKELAQVEKDLLASRAKLDAIAKQEANTLDQLKSKYQAGYGAMKTFKGEVEQLNLALKLGVVTQDEYKAKVEQLSVALAKGTGIFGAHANQARGYMNQLGVITQQAGYQVGDFFVQIQSGTNVFVALGQQATQLAGTFAMLATSTKMIGIFTGLGIAIPIVTSILAFMTRTTAETKNTVDAFQKLRDATKELYIERMKLIDSKFDENLEGTAQKLSELKVAYEEAAASAKEVTLLEQIIQGTPLAALGTFWEEYQKSQEKATKAKVEGAEATLKEYNMEKGLAYARDRNNAQIDAQNEQGIRDLEKKKALLEASEQMERNIAKYANSRTVDAQNQAAAAKKLADELGQAYLDALNLGKADVSSGIDKAAEAARLLAKDMGISLAAAMDIVDVASLADKGGRAFKYGPSYDSSNTRSGAYGNQDTNAYTPSMAAQAARKNREWVAANPAAEKDTSSSGAVAGRIDTQEEYLAKLAREYDMKKKSLGLTDEQIKRNQFLFTLDEKIATMKTKRTEQEIETERKRAVAAYDAYVAAERQDDLMKTVNSNINDAFLSMVDGSNTVVGAFRNMMFNILKSVYEQSVTQPIANAFTGILKGALTGGISVGGSGSLFGGASWSANGDVVGRSGIQAFANGGVVNSATMFKHGGGLGVMGEAGPEAIMPLKRGSNGQLGVQVNGNAGGMTVNNNITVTGSDAAAVRMEVAKMIPQITNATKAAIIDAKKRGGQMGAAFA